jgi:hypothetical protein
MGFLLTAIAILGAFAAAPGAARAVTRSGTKKKQARAPTKDKKKKKRWARVFKEAAKQLVAYYYGGGRKPARIARLQEILRIPTTGYVDTTTEARVIALLGKVEWYPGQFKEERRRLRKKRAAAAKKKRKKKKKKKKPARMTARVPRKIPAAEPTDGPGLRGSKFLVAPSAPSTRFVSSFGSARVFRSEPGPTLADEPEEPAPDEVTVAPEVAAKVLRHYTRDGGNQGKEGFEDEVVSLAQFYMGLRPADGVIGQGTRERAKELGYPLYRRRHQKPSGIDQGKYLEALGIG